MSKRSGDPDRSVGAVLQFCLYALTPKRRYAFVPLCLCAKIIINYYLIIKQPLNKFVYLLSE